MLAAIVFALTDRRNVARPLANLAPVFIGLTVTALISILAPLTQACFNPARDFGPRLFAYYAGWGDVAFPGLSDLGWLTVYIVAPIAGAVAGGGFYQCLLRPSLPEFEASVMRYLLASLLVCVCVGGAVARRRCRNSRARSTASLSSQAVQSPLRTTLTFQSS